MAVFGSIGSKRLTACPFGGIGGGILGTVVFWNSLFVEVHCPAPSEVSGGCDVFWRNDGFIGTSGLPTSGILGSRGTASTGYSVAASSFFIKLCFR